MKSTLRPGSKTQVTLEASDRNNFDKAVCALKFAADHDQRDDASKLAQTIAQDLTAFLMLYPDTRKGKKDPQKRLPGTELDKTKETP